MRDELYLFLGQVPERVEKARVAVPAERSHAMELDELFSRE